MSTNRTAVVLGAALSSAVLLLAGCATTGVWERWEAGERARYFGLTWVAPDSVVEVYRSLPERASRDSCYRMYWDGVDPSGRAEAEHKARVGRARELFGGETFHRDERSAYWVRHGKPDLQMAYHAQPHAVDMRHSKILIEQPWELWEYKKLGFSVDFLKKGDYYRAVWSMSSDRRRPVAFFTPDTSLKMDCPDQGAFGRGKLGLRHARFRAERPELMRWELYWWLPLEKLSGDRCLAAVSITSGDNMVKADTFACRLVRPPEGADDPFAFGQSNYDLAPGYYRATVSLIDPGAGAQYVDSVKAELLAYRPGIQESSDVEFALLSDTTYIAPQFRKGPYRRVIAMPGEEVDRFQPFFVYYEIYNLSVTPDSGHYISINHQIYSTDDLGMTKECLINTDPIESTGKGSTYRGSQKIHLLSERLPAGSYVLRVNADDLISGRSSQALLGFRLRAADRGGDGSRRN